MRFRIPYDSVPEQFRVWLAKLGIEENDDVKFACREDVSDAELYAEFTALCASNGGKRMAALAILAEKYNYSLRHVYRRIRRFEKSHR